MTRQINVGGVPVGGGAPVSVQTMCKTRGAGNILRELAGLRELGCDIVRVAVPDARAAEELKAVCAGSPLPVVADIHFDYRLAIAAVKAGAAKIRLNPGNIGGPERVKAVAEACRQAGVPIRVGVNAGSLKGEGLVASALEQIKTLEDAGFTDYCVSVKSSSVRETVDAYRQLAKLTSAPLHIGLTEAGTPEQGVIKSAAAIGALLSDGIGDTIRVSLTGPAAEEVRAGAAILKACGLRRHGVDIISCPTCGRCAFPVEQTARFLREKLKDRPEPLTVAVMGCAVNGPGEASAADYGIAGGSGNAVLFCKGKIVQTVPEQDAAARLLALIDAHSM
jgi:(E)-4-hydroxy-3-methylbut-2-enyl-diphosphate synthase